MAHPPRTPGTGPRNSAGRPHNPGRDRRPGGPGAALDRGSKQIIEQLQQDGRRSYPAIGQVCSEPSSGELRRRSFALL